MSGAAQGRPGRGAERPKRGLRETLTTAFATDLAAEVEALFGAGAARGVDFEALETTVRHRTLDFVARLVEGRLNADHGDHVGARVPCGGCGGHAAYMGRRPKTVTTVVGRLRLRRAYHHCATRWNRRKIHAA